MVVRRELSRFLYLERLENILELKEEGAHRCFLTDIVITSMNTKSYDNIIMITCRPQAIVHRSQKAEKLPLEDRMRRRCGRDLWYGMNCETTATDELLRD